MDKQTSIEKRSISRGANSSEDLNPLEGTRPMSLTMGPHLIWLNALGDTEAQAITEAWRPHFVIKEVETVEGAPWE